MLGSHLRGNSGTLGKCLGHECFSRMQTRVSPAGDRGISIHCSLVQQGMSPPHRLNTEAQRGQCPREGHLESLAQRGGPGHAAPTLPHQ